MFGLCFYFCDHSVPISTLCFRHSIIGAVNIRSYEVGLESMLFISQCEDITITRLIYIAKVYSVLLTDSVPHVKTCTQEFNSFLFGKLVEPFWTQILNNMFKHICKKTCLIVCNSISPNVRVTRQFNAL